MARFEAAIFEMLDFQLRRQGLCSLIQRGMGALRHGGDACIDAERQADQRMAEQQAFDFGQRQDTFDPAVGFDVEKRAAMAKCLFDHCFPTGAVEKCRLRAGLHEFVPTGKIGGLQLA